MDGEHLILLVDLSDSIEKEKKEEKEKEKEKENERKKKKKILLKLMKKKKKKGVTPYRLAKVPPLVEILIEVRVSDLPGDKRGAGVISKLIVLPHAALAHSRLGAGGAHGNHHGHTLGAQASTKKTREHLISLIKL